MIVRVAIVVKMDCMKNGRHQITTFEARKKLVVRCTSNESKKGFIAFIGAGDPNIESTKNISLELAQSGVDIIELGVPFSDPLADGATIQKANSHALRQGVTLRSCLQVCAALR